MNVRSSWSRPLLGIVGAGAGAVLLVALAVTLADSLAIAEQPGRSIGVPAVSVQPTGASTAAATPTPMPSTPSSSPEVVPAQDPVVVDDHGGDNPGHDDDSGPDDSGGSSGSGSSGSGSSSG